MDAGVEWSFASFWARDNPEPCCAEEEEERRDERFKKSVAKKEPEPSESGPLAYECGQSEGIVEDMAFSDVCSPIQGQ